jgi:hypothetical protein
VVDVVGIDSGVLVDNGRGGKGTSIQSDGDDLSSGPSDILLLTFGVPIPSSLRSASAVSGSFLVKLRRRDDSDRFNVPLVAELDAGNGALLVVGKVIEPEPRRNWFIEALEGLGGKCEKSRGANCLMISWCEELGLVGVLCFASFRGVSEEAGAISDGGRF